MAEPGHQVLDRRVAARAGDGTFDREYHEVAYMIEGAVEIETDDGRVLRAGAGDVIVTPEGSSGLWRARTPVRKFWAVHHE